MDLYSGFRALVFIICGLRVYVFLCCLRAFVVFYAAIVCTFGFGFRVVLCTDTGS